MGFSRSLSARCLIVLAFTSLGACSSEPKQEPANEGAGRGGSPALMVDNPGSAGTTLGSAGMVATSAGAGSGAGASGASASSAGKGGASAGTGGSPGSMAVMAGSSAAGTSAQPDAGVPAEEEDPFGLFGPTEVSCEGLLCLEAADCATLYPEENASCKFTDCVDFMCM